MVWDISSDSWTGKEPHAHHMHSLGHRLCRCHRSFDRSFDSAPNPNHLPQPSLFLERCTCRFCIFSVRNGGNATSHEKCVLFFHCPLQDPNTVWGFLSKRTIITTITPNFKHLLLVVVVDDDVVVVVVVAIRMPLKYHNSFFPHSSCHSSGSVQAMPISIIFQYSKFVCWGGLSQHHVFQFIYVQCFNGEDATKHMRVEIFVCFDSFRHCDTSKNLSRVTCLDCHNCHAESGGLCRNSSGLCKPLSEPRTLCILAANSRGKLMVYLANMKTREACTQKWGNGWRSLYL